MAWIITTSAPAVTPDITRRLVPCHIWIPSLLTNLASRSPKDTSKRSRVWMSKRRCGLGVVCCCGLGEFSGPLALAAGNPRKFRQPAEERTLAPLGCDCRHWFFSAWSSPRSALGLAPSYAGLPSTQSKSGARSFFVVAVSRFWKRRLADSQATVRKRWLCVDCHLYRELLRCGAQCRKPLRHSERARVLRLQTGEVSCRSSRDLESRRYRVPTACRQLDPHRCTRMSRPTLGRQHSRTVARTRR